MLLSILKGRARQLEKLTVPIVMRQNLRYISKVATVMPILTKNPMPPIAQTATGHMESKPNQTKLLRSTDHRYPNFAVNATEQEEKLCREPIWLRKMPFRITPTVSMERVFRRKGCFRQPSVPIVIRHTGSSRNLIRDRRLTPKTLPLLAGIATKGFLTSIFPVIMLTGLKMAT